MSDDDLEVAVLAAWLRDTDFEWLDQVACVAIPEGGIGRAEADQILRLHALYSAVRAEFPNLQPSRGMLNSFMHVDSDSRVSDDLHGGPLRPSCDYGVSGCHVDVADVVAAATLGRNGALTELLVACDLLCHGYNYYGGDGRPLIDEYRFLLPAIASFSSAPTRLAFSDVVCGPGWWDSEGSQNLATRLNPLARALHPSITKEERRLLVSGHPDVDQTYAYLFTPVADVFGIDCSFLTEAERGSVDELWEDLLDNLSSGDPDDPEETAEFFLEPIHLAYVVAANVEELLNEADLIDPSDPQARAVLKERHRWVGDWGLNSWTYTQCWPPGWLGEAIARSPWHGPISFIQGLPQGARW